MSQVSRFRVAMAITVLVVVEFVRYTGCWHPSIILVVTGITFAVVGTVMGVD